MIAILSLLDVSKYDLAMLFSELVLRDPKGQLELLNNQLDYLILVLSVTHLIIVDSFALVKEETEENGLRVAIHLRDH